MTAGRKWYICGVNNHCAAYGQKLAITVQYSYGWAPGPAPSSPWAPTPEPWTPSSPSVPATRTESRASAPQPWTPAPSSPSTPAPTAPWPPAPSRDPWI
ncbi:hypothetical protein QQP08_016056 [Theobroma cacao]|nr:hypothetical protein QQP08_016056 [Theobroma cacao]